LALLAKGTRGAVKVRSDVMEWLVAGRVRAGVMRRLDSITRSCLVSHVSVDFVYDNGSGEVADPIFLPGATYRS